MNTKQFEELLLQSLEHELGGVEVYSTALGCAQNSDLKQEWQEYLEQTRKHVTALQEVCAALGVSADAETPGRRIVRDLGKSLVAAMNQALSAGDPTAAELVACECVVLAETKDHADWQLLGKCAAELPGLAADALKQAYDRIEDEEDEHLYHTRGWCRELWLQSLGLPAVLPPPEEQQHVKTAIGAARAEQAGEKLRLESNRQKAE
jgi:protein-disulfide isomerase-like protein with CxxC motif